MLNQILLDFDRNLRKASVSKCFRKRLLQLVDFTCSNDE